MLLVAKLARLLRYHSIALISPKFKGWGGWCVLSLLVVGCAALPPQAAPLPSVQMRPLALPADPAVALPLLVQLENQACIARDLTQLEQLWTEASRVVDGRGTVDLGDNYIWAGRLAILDRYRLAVFPNPPPLLTLPPDLAIQVTGNQATLHNGQDRWRFVHQEGRWWISELVYSQP